MQVHKITGRKKNSYILSLESRRYYLSKLSLKLCQSIQISYNQKGSNQDMWTLGEVRAWWVTPYSYFLIFFSCVEPSHRLWKWPLVFLSLHSGLVAARPWSSQPRVGLRPLALTVDGPWDFLWQTQRVRRAVVPVPSQCFAGSLQPRRVIPRRSPSPPPTAPAAVRWDSMRRIGKLPQVTAAWPQMHSQAKRKSPKPSTDPKNVSQV